MAEQTSAFGVSKFEKAAEESIRRAREIASLPLDEMFHELKIPFDCTGLPDDDPEDVVRTRPSS